MKKGTFEKATQVKPVEGKSGDTKVKGGEVKFGYTPAGRPGKKAK